MKEEVKSKSIRARGNTTHNKPSYECSNCGCIRYNPCTCMKNDMSRSKVKKAKRGN